jgi:hypothetical protein
LPADVLVELLLKIVLSLFGLRESGHRDFKILGCTLYDPGHRSARKPFGHADITLMAAHQIAACHGRLVSHRLQSFASLRARIRAEAREKTVGHCRKDMRNLDLFARLLLRDRVTEFDDQLSNACAVGCLG